MKRKNKRLMAYLGMPLIFITLGYLIIFLLASPVLKPMLSTMRLFLTEGNTITNSELNSIFDTSKIKAENTVKESEVVIPNYGTHYAELEIAESNVKAPVYFGDSDSVLRKGLGQYLGSMIPGYGKPILISGHNNTFFKNLKNVKVGDNIKITTSYGVYEYKVTNSKIANANDKSAYDLGQEKEELILYTCYPFDALGLINKRYFVYADKVSGPIII